MKRSKALFEFGAIGTVRTCFKEKFGIPRQPGLVAGALGTIKLEDDPDLRTAIKNLEEFSHLWLIWVFHEHGSRNWKPSIRPPRLGGARKVGVLASRSPHRPNPIGLSVVKIEAVRADAPGGAEIDVSGVDLLDGTPLLDIKPYIPYADSVPEARGGWAEEAIARTEVQFEPKALEIISGRAELESLIVEMLELDPRPAFQKKKLPPEHPDAQGTRYGFFVLNYDVKWEIRDGAFWVLDLIEVAPKT